jgi:spore coat polysaccharide biosynthesis predicted glycosyltransferase SpsG
LSIDENQRPACEALAQNRVIQWAGHHDLVTEQDLREALVALTDDLERLRSLATASRALVDGNGTQRVAEQLMAHQKAA